MKDLDRLNVRLKLLSENNVILAKCEGMETEVFMPAIIDGRISIINVIPQRRCNCISTTHLVARRKVTDGASETSNETLSNWQVTMSNHKNNQQGCEPLANSTPAQLKLNKIKGNEKSSDISISAPEPIRHALAEAHTSITTPIAGIEKYLPFNSFNYEQSSNQVVQRSPDTHDFQDFETPTYSLTHLGWPQTPPPKQLLKTGNNTLQTPSIASPEIPQWRKVLTPVRTYARRNHKLNTTFRPLIDEVPQQHIENATQAPSSNLTSVLKFCRLVVDKKLAISPRSFKQQLKSDSSDILHQQHRKEVKNFFEGVSKKIAFELLTTPATRPNVIAKPLTDLFRKRCVNKGSSTYPKYRKLCLIKPVEQEASTRILEIDQSARLRAINAKTSSITSTTMQNLELIVQSNDVQLTESRSQRVSDSAQNPSLISPNSFHINKPILKPKKSKNLPQKMLIPFSS